MVRPASFGWNPQTGVSNHFQPSQPPVSAGDAGTRAIAEFDGLAAALAQAGVEVHALADLPEPACPDAVFPNNWVSLHADGTVVLYPMLAPNRRGERRLESAAGTRAARRIRRDAVARPDASRVAGPLPRRHRQRRVRSRGARRLCVPVAAHGFRGARRALRRAWLPERGVSRRGPGRHCPSITRTSCSRSAAVARWSAPRPWRKRSVARCSSISPPAAAASRRSASRR
jgi:hypothetical protein